MGAPAVNAPQRPAAWERPPRTPETDTSSRLFSYVVLRVTGLVLSVLVLGHFAVTHLVTDVARDNSAFVARRLSSTVWIVWDGAMLAAALAHGAFGVRLAIADSSCEARARRLWERALAGLVLVLFVLGLIVIGRAANA